jgi:hypothetical protein
MCVGTQMRHLNRAGRTRRRDEVHIQMLITHAYGGSVVVAKDICARGKRR